MIRINLLPTEGPGPSKVYAELIAGLVILAIAAAGIGMDWNYLNGVIADRQHEVAEKKEQVKKLEDIIASVNKYEKEKQKLEKKKNLIKNLRENQRGPVTLLDVMSKVVPDNVWYTRLNQSENQITLMGAALSMMSVGDLMSALKDRKDLIQDVQLKNTRRRVIRGRDIFTFKLQITLKGNIDTRKGAKGKGKGPGK